MTEITRSNLYSAGIGADHRHYVEGPGNGLGYHSGTLFPEMRLSNEGNAKAAALIANEAYRQGYARAQRDIRNALGVSND